MCMCKYKALIVSHAVLGYLLSVICGTKYYLLDAVQAQFKSTG
jgi:hypothetical protein